MTTKEEARAALLKMMASEMTALDSDAAYIQGQLAEVERKRTSLKDRMALLASGGPYIATNKAAA